MNFVFVIAIFFPLARLYDASVRVFVGVRLRLLRQDVDSTSLPKVPDNALGSRVVNVKALCCLFCRPLLNIYQLDKLTAFVSLHECIVKNSLSTPMISGICVNILVSIHYVFSLVLILNC